MSSLKQDLQNVFPKFAKTAIKKFDDGYELSGKFINVAQMENGDWDVFIYNAKNIIDGLSETKLTGILESTRPYPKTIGDITRLSGEAFFQSNDFDSLSQWLLANRVRLGIKKRVKNTHSTFKSAATGQVGEKRFIINTNVAGI